MDDGRVYGELSGDGLTIEGKWIEDHGRGVFTNLTTREEIETAFSVAQDEGSEVIVERFIPGNEHRLLVVGGRMVAASRGETAQVVGDGKSTVLELIELQLNSDPRRGNSEDHPLNRVRLDSAARLEVRRQGFEPDGVPPEGKVVVIQRNGNVSIDCTAEVHPDTAETVALAARIVGLDIAGVDLVVEDVSKPLADQGGAIVEVNAGPGLLMHIKPAAGEPQPVGKAIVEHLFPNGDSGRIPVVGISGGKGKTTVARVVTRLLELSGHYTGLACSTGLYLDRRLVEAGDRAQWDTARRVLMNRSVQAAVIENSATSIVTEGLAYDRCQVGVLTNFEPIEDLSKYYMDSPEKRFTTLRTQVDVVLPTGVAVLNAREPQLVEMAELCDGEVIYFAADPSLPVLAEHRSKGGRAVLLREGAVVLAKGWEETKLLDLAQVPMAAGSEAFQAENVLAAVATARALDIAPEVIRAGLETFVLDAAPAI
jgi:cyanophycin synthetase